LRVRDVRGIWTSASVGRVDEVAVTRSRGSDCEQEVVGTSWVGELAPAGIVPALFWR